MKQVLLLRHAKSSWEIPQLKDFDRPLAKRGEKDAPNMGKFLKKAGYIPGQIISSPAKRAEGTTNLVIESAELDEDVITWNNDLYYGNSSDYFSAIKQANDIIERIMLVGHNPNMEEVASRLIGKGNIRVPTAALLCFEQPANKWEQIKPGLAELKWMMIPKVVKQIL
ncbi:MAG: histidine phosphatase family protein [Balneolaceae bacterium]|nr:histidine phosphatase family protein [Balneolaceae bacterium]